MANINYHEINIHEDIERPLNAVMAKDLSTAVKVEFHLLGEGESDFLQVKWFNGEGQICEGYFNKFYNRWLRSQFITALTALFELPFEVINHDMDDVANDADDAGADGGDNDGADDGDDDTIDDMIDFPSDADGTIDWDEADTDDADDTE
ncbi:hypothetical protein SEMRO_1129_G244380.1 [Seminavis robusta]|uniref:Uncharacterized protein n=1 Tax=Seminavis robusta TaxID=568900 RepID=A0A9N8EGJ4_9STRA|nr:hypothetical protein SEMRO_1129_G244380.1 [Seminavis robusta]|eukprot:Sro1129_g244380.1 n/a (150) ;mRNA; r:21816-22265